MKDNKVWFWVLVFVVFAILTGIATSCHPVSTRPFDPDEKQNVEEERYKSAGYPDRYETDCLKIYKAELDMCMRSSDCTRSQQSSLERAIRRVGHFTGRKCYSNIRR